MKNNDLQQAFRLSLPVLGAFPWRTPCQTVTIIYDACKATHTFNDSHPYFPKDCNHCPVRGASGFTNKLRTVFSNQKKHCFNCQFIDGCLPMQKRAVEHIKKIRQNIHPFEGDLIEDKGFLSGRLRVFRGSLDTVYSHAKEDGNIIKWLKTYSKNSVKGWKYEGWAPNRPYSPDNPHFDPKNPDKKKHLDTKHFLYYSLEINGKNIGQMSSSTICQEARFIYHRKE